jgi:hypothetical protein
MGSGSAILAFLLLLLVVVLIQGALTIVSGRALSGRARTLAEA